MRLTLERNYKQIRGAKNPIWDVFVDAYTEDDGSVYYERTDGKGWVRAMVDSLAASVTTESDKGNPIIESASALSKEFRELVHALAYDENTGTVKKNFRENFGKRKFWRVIQIDDKGITPVRFSEFSTEHGLKGDKK